MLKKIEIIKETDEKLTNLVPSHIPFDSYYIKSFVVGRADRNNG